MDMNSHKSGGMDANMMTHGGMGGGDLSQTIQANSALLGVVLVGFIIGIISIIFVLRVMRRVGGRLRRALVPFVIGLVFMTVAFLASFVFTIFAVMSVTEMAIHMGLMLVGMILFVLSAYQFSKLMDP